MDKNIVHILRSDRDPDVLGRENAMRGPVREVCRPQVQLVQRDGAASVVFCPC